MYWICLWRKWMNNSYPKLEKRKNSKGSFFVCTPREQLQRRLDSWNRLMPPFRLSLVVVAVEVVRLTGLIVMTVADLEPIQGTADRRSVILPPPTGSKCIPCIFCSSSSSSSRLILWLILSLSILPSSIEGEREESFDTLGPLWREACLNIFQNVPFLVLWKVEKVHFYRHLILWSAWYNEWEERYWKVSESVGDSWTVDLNSN